MASRDTTVPALAPAGDAAATTAPADNTSDGVIIRHARREDIPTILALIHELAAFENASHEVQATPTLLAQTLSFAPAAPKAANANAAGPEEEAEEEPPPSALRPARALLLFAPPPSTPIPSSTPSSTPDPHSHSHSQPPEPPEAAALALYYYNYSTWRCRPGIYLEDLYVRPRHRRRGHAGRLLGVLAREVLAMDAGGRLEWSVLRWNERARVAYGRLGAVVMEEWVGMRVQGREGLMALVERAVGVGEGEDGDGDGGRGDE